MNKDRLKEFEAIFNPQSIAMVGASRQRRPGGVALAYLLRAGYKGKIFPVNPNEKEIMGLTAYPSVKDIPGSVDYAIIMVPAAIVPGIIDDCAAKGVKAVQIFAADFF